MEDALAIGVLAPVPRRSHYDRAAITVAGSARILKSGSTKANRTILRDADTMSQLLVRGGVGLGSPVAGLAALVPSLRPEMDPTYPKRILTAALIVLAMVAATQLSADEATLEALYLGASLGRSPWMLALLAVPSFICLAIGIRFEAPTHLSVTGAALGLASGGVGASIYALGCDVSSTSLGLAWSSIGICMTTVGGMLIAPRFLHW